MATRVFAIAAHPDDIEFGMAGTLILLAGAGCEIHYMNIANGSCGSTEHDAQATAEIRLIEATNAADRIGAVFHRPLVCDIEIFYEKELLARVASIMRAVVPDILLVPLAPGLHGRSYQCLPPGGYRCVLPGNEKLSRESAQTARRG